MANKKSGKENEPIIEWTNVIHEMGKKERELNKKLSPSKSQIRCIVDYARAILEKANYMELVSSLGHEGEFSFERAQQIMNCQKEQMEHDIKSLLTYLSPIE